MLLEWLLFGVHMQNQTVHSRCALVQARFMSVEMITEPTWSSFGLSSPALLWAHT